MAEQEDVAGLVAFIDRLEALLERSSLTELEVEVEGTTVVLRTAAALAPPPVSALTHASASTGGPSPLDAAGPAGAPTAPVLASQHAQAFHTVVAPLTGVFYRSPSPGAQQYVREGAQVSAGQVIGLIEAMKLFNEIKSDISGTVRHVAAGDGDLVKAKQTLIEVDPS